MSQITELLGDVLSGDTASMISKQLDIGEGETKSTLSAAIPLLMGALDSNTNEEGGAEALSNALDKDHDGSILDNVTDYLSGDNASTGSAILKHVLGGKEEGVESQLGALSGLSSGKVKQVLAIVAPLVLGALGKEKRSRGLDAGSLSSLLTDEHNYAREKSPEGLDFLGKLLSSGGDSSSLGDMSSIGGTLLKSFLK